MTIRQDSAAQDRPGGPGGHSEPVPESGSQQPLDKWLQIRADTGGLQLHIRSWVGTKEPFVLLHGLASNSRTWDRVAQRLAAAGHPVVAVDQRGHGLSDKPADGYDFATLADDLASLLDELGIERPLLAGQSWGGNVVLAFAAQHGARARALVMVDGGYIDLQMRPDATWERVADELRPPQLVGIPRRDLKARIQAAHPEWSEEGVEATLGNFEALADGTVRPWLTLERHMAILRAMWEQLPGTLYGRVQAPVLIAVAEDSTNPAWMAVKHQQVDAAAAALRHVSVHWFADTAHDIHVHRPDELATLMLLWSQRTRRGDHHADAMGPSSA